MTALLEALICTIVIEGLVMLALTRRLQWVYFNLLCNMVTNPLLNLLLKLVWTVWPKKPVYYTAVAVGELLVLFAETLFYRLMSEEDVKKCFLRSLITNAASFLLGLLLL